MKGNMNVHNENMRVSDANNKQQTENNINDVQILIYNILQFCICEIPETERFIAAIQLAF
jgi:hypothetical protein